ncbi:glycosyltransferase [bacterium]|nr:glycosyltransferase [bacterium]
MAKVDLHVHSKYSNRPSEWFLQKLGASESYTEPDQIYEMAKGRGMSFVTITDHNTMEGSLELSSKYSDAFTGMEATTYFPEDGCKVHLLIWGADQNQFEAIMNYRSDIYELRDYLADVKLAHSVAHPTYAINGMLSIEHMEKLVLLFDVFESINGGQGHASNSTLYYYLKYLTEDVFEQLQIKHQIKPQRRNSWVKGYTGGSDDHGGIYIGQTYSMAGATTPEEFLSHVRGRKSFAKGRFNDFQSLAFTVYKIAHDYSRQHSKPISNFFGVGGFSNLIFGQRKANLLDVFTVLSLKADSQKGYKKQIADLLSEIQRSKITSIQDNLDKLYDTIANISDEMLEGLVNSLSEKLKEGDFFSLISKISAAIPGLFLLVPFFTSLHHLNNNRKLLSDMRVDLPRNDNRKILWFTDTINDLNGVSVTLRHLGWQFYANGIDISIVSCLTPDELSDALPPSMINLPVVSSFDLPFYEHLSIKIPSLLKALKQLHKFEPDEIFVSTPGPVGILGVLAARLFSLPLTGIYHTDFSMELSEISKDDDNTVNRVESYTRWFYSMMDEIKVPTNEYIEILSQRGLGNKKMNVFPRQIDHEAFSLRQESDWGNHRINIPDGMNLLYVGRISKDKNLEFLINVYHKVRELKDDVNLIFAGDGPFRPEMERMLGDDPRIQILGKVAYDALPIYYSQADLLVFPSITDTYGMVVLEAQCCELPALVSDKGGPKEIVQDRETGFVLPALKLEPWVQKILRVHQIMNEDPHRYEEICHSSRRLAIQRSGWEALLKQLTREELLPKAILLADNA